MVRLGQRLHKARLQKELSLDQVAHATKIKARFLAAIEKGEYDKLPSPAYAQGFVRNYATYLGFHRTEILALFRREFDDKRAFKVLPDSMTKTKEFSLNRVRLHQSVFLIAGIFLLFLGYIAFQYRYLVIAPSLSLTSPTEAIVTIPDVTIAGKTDKNATVLVNNQAVSLNSDGEFRKTVTLFPGKSVVTIKAKNRIGKETIQRREIEVKLE